MKAIKHRLFTLVNSVTSFISANGGGGELNKVAICKIQFKKVIVCTNLQKLTMKK